LSFANKELWFLKALLIFVFLIIFVDKEFLAEASEKSIIDLELVLDLL